MNELTIELKLLVQGNEILIKISKDMTLRENIENVLKLYHKYIYKYYINTMMIIVDQYSGAILDSDEIVSNLNLYNGMTLLLY